ncbi:unnamed protein product [Brachionus calyciflorus]|uniref:Uncharacterized protein n=1 Tax=Brachionus calyciflorus TaxID=104777 RepID=A0A814FN89_9BILA|nr:unnamed protein product [Brachionus calyciflorus]
MSTNLLCDNDDLSFMNFTMSCKGILDEFTVMHSSKKRQIEMVFDRLIDNVPNEIINAPITECLQEYFDSLKTKEFQILAPAKEKNEEVVDESVCDSTISVASNDKAPSNLTTLEDELVGGSVQEFKNLTSTVKKVNGGKLKSLKDKIDEQSIIQEVDDETPTKEPKKITKINKENVKPFKIDKYSLKVLYFLKDLTQVTASLNELAETDEKMVHESSLEDFKLLVGALAARQQSKK